MESKVTVLTPHGRRQNIKVTPNTTLLQILEEVCQKHGFDSDEYCLKHHNKEVGLTQMFRFSGLPNNCLLEMSQTDRKRVIANADICVQLEDGSRVQGQFKPSATLWQVVETLSAEVANNYDSPVAIYMRQEIVGKQQLEGTTLKTLGILEGRALIRLINKKPEELKTQANVYLPSTSTAAKDTEYAVQTARTSAKPIVGGSGSFAVTKDMVKSLKPQEADAVNKDNVAADAKIVANAEPEPAKPKYEWGTGQGHSMSGIKLPPEQEQETEEKPPPEPEFNIVGSRNAILFSLDSIQKAADDVSDSFFDLTVHDLKLVLRDLKKISSGSEDAPLMTERLRELEAQTTMINKLAQYKNCVIRVQFPDRRVLQGIFKPVDKITQVMDFVREFLTNPNMKFYLFTIPPKVVLPLEQTLLELDFVPTAVIHFAPQNDEDTGSTEEKCYLKAELLEKSSSVEGALYAANKFRSLTNRASASGSSGAYQSKSPDSSTGAVPKRPRSNASEEQEFI